MAKSVIILGAKGRFGRAAIQEFINKGWQVTAFARSWHADEKNAPIRYLTGSASDKTELQRACMGHSVIVNAVNPPYENWEASLPAITDNVIASGIACGATIVIPGNVYNYGNKLPDVLTEDTPHIANIKKGRLRIEMEQAYRNAAQKGLRTIILRGGDFIEGKDTGNWFETYITNKLDKGQITYPGPLDSIHAWAYLPDMARAMAELAERRTSLNAFEEFGFRGFAVTGVELVATLSRITKQNLKVKRFPWTLVRIMGLFSKLIHEVLEMRYLWNRPHEIDDTKLRSVLPDFEPTPFEIAIKQAIRPKLTSKNKTAVNPEPAITNI